jgi:hypothetical protein
LLSGEVLQAGLNLIQKFLKTQLILKEIYNRAYEETFAGTVDEIKHGISWFLQEFDNLWVDFEQLYIHELMVIESDARWCIEEAIQLNMKSLLLKANTKK